LSLIERVRDPDNTIAWREFVTLYTPIIFGFLTKRGLSVTDAEDVTESPKVVGEELGLSLDNVYQKKSRVTARVKEAIRGIDGGQI